MLRLKKYKKTEFAHRFRRYRVLFLCGAALMASGLIVSFFLVQTPRAVFSGETGFSELFFRLFLRSALPLLIGFLIGLTIYAPAWQALSSLASGFFSGFAFFSVLKAGSVLKTLFFALFFLLILWLYQAYFSFCTLVSLRLFTDGNSRDPTEEEGRVFGGTLFNSVLFQETVNLRFLFSYSLFFLFALLCCAALSALYAASLLFV